MKSKPVGSVVRLSKEVAARLESRRTHERQTASDIIEELLNEVDAARTGRRR